MKSWLRCKKLQVAAQKKNLVVPFVGHKELCLARKAISKRKYKYGVCASCGVALRPDVHRSGVHAGQCVLRCGRWWEVTDKKRGCWLMQKFTGDVASLPKDVRRSLGLAVD